jgi:hypothetical protein
MEGNFRYITTKAIQEAQILWRSFMNEVAEERIARLEGKVEDLTNMLEDVVNELPLTEIAVEHHGQMGTPPAELVRIIIEAKDETIARLKAGLKMV